MKTHRLAALAASTILIANPVLAQDGLDLGTLILSGGFTPIEAEKFGRSASVITGEEIERRGLTSVQDALRSVPGVAVSSTGNNFTQVRIRGGEGNHTLVLIDGVEAAGNGSEYILSGLDTANIERIEILRGPQSVLYGANASSGVVNIITRTGVAGQQYSVSATVGTSGSTFLSAFASSRNARGGLSLSIAENRDAGWDFSGDGGERDGTDRHTIIFKGDYRVADPLKMGFNLRYSDERYDFDNTATSATEAGYVVDTLGAFSEREEKTFSFFGEYGQSDSRITHRLTYELTDNAQAFFGGADTFSLTEVYQYIASIGLDGSASSADHLLNVLLENQNERSSSNAFSRNTQSVGLEYRGSFSNGLSLQAGVRYDDRSAGSDNTPWNLGVSYTLPGRGVRLHASAGAGSVDPSFFELFANAFGFTGNPNLSPEENQSFDIGVEVPIFNGRGSVDVTYFNETLTSEITAVPTGATTSTFINEPGDSTREGIEIEGRLEATPGVDLRLFYTFLEAKNSDGTVEQRRPENELGVGVIADVLSGRGSVAADMRYVSGVADLRRFGSGGVATVPDYFVFDVSGRYSVSSSVDAVLRIENVFDERYTDAFGYVARDRTVLFGFDANF
ncbi:MAG: TonB-dependent receptor [Pseudomonadota bacterium]